MNWMCFALKLQGQKKTQFTQQTSHIQAHTHCLDGLLRQLKMPLSNNRGMETKDTDSFTRLWTEPWRSKQWKTVTVTLGQMLWSNAPTTGSMKYCPCIHDAGSKYGLCWPPPAVVGNDMVMASISVRHSSLPETPTSTRNLKCSCLVYFILWYKLSHLKITEDELFLQNCLAT